jgi:proteasome lid subunit RPN8/RPN11
MRIIIQESDEMNIPPAAVAAMQADAVSRYPDEACGFLLHDDSVVCLNNRAADPRTAFAISATDYLRHDGRIKAVWHSHPDGPECPSAADMTGQIAAGLPWIIIACGSEAARGPIIWGADPPSLLGREFVHGVTDCYSLIRDWFALERGVALPDFAREDEWWAAGGDLYRLHFAAAGFAAVPMEEMAAGDVVLMQVRSAVPSHGGVVLEGGLLLHHLTGRLSRREPLGPWRRMMTHVLRYFGGEI